MVAALGANQPKQTSAGKMPWLLGDCLPTNQLRVVQLPGFLQPERPLACVNNGVRAAGESIMLIAFDLRQVPERPNAAGATGDAHIVSSESGNGF